jgi:hypothetical protein
VPVLRLLVVLLDLRPVVFFAVVLREVVLFAGLRLAVVFFAPAFAFLIAIERLLFWFVCNYILFQLQLYKNSLKKINEIYKYFYFLKR